MKQETTSYPMSAHGKVWKLAESPPPDLAARLGQSELVAALLYQRHLCDPAEVEQFFCDSYPHGMHSALLLKGMHEASTRIAQAIANGERMAVYGDFDADGVTAVTLLMQALPALGGLLEPYIPHRDSEGYGLNVAAIERLAAQGISLLITVDCGISNVEEVARANALDMDVIVTDHHQPPPVLPPAHAIVNPKQPGCAYPFKQLVGVGIAFKLVQALVKQGLRLPLRGRDMLDVVALGTVADMGPLNGENRVLVRAGLEALHTTARPGLRALIQAAGLTPSQVDASAIGFMLGPRINAAGRLDHAMTAYKLLLADDQATAHTLAHELDITNRERQLLTQTVVEQANAEYEAQCAAAEAAGQPMPRLVLLSSTDYPAGIVGLVAGKLVERWARPTILLARGEDVSRGSARSIRGFNIFHALSTCKDLFVRFGGHSMAAGFTIENERLPELETRLHTLVAAELSDEALQPTLTIDAEVPFAQLGWDLFAELARLEPFGQANPQPVLMSRHLHVRQVRQIGQEGKHLKLQVAQPNAQAGGLLLDAVAFHLGHLAEPLRRAPLVDLAYTLERNTWRDRTSLQLNVKDLRRAVS